MEEKSLRDHLLLVFDELAEENQIKLVAEGKLILAAQRTGLDWPVNKTFTRFSEKVR